MLHRGYAIVLVVCIALVVIKSFGILPLVSSDQKHFSTSFWETWQMLLQNFANFLCKKIRLPDFLFFHQLCSGIVIVTFTSFHLLFIVLTVFLLFVLVYIGLETNWLNVPTIKLNPKHKLVDMELHYFYLFIFILPPNRSGFEPHCSGYRSHFR